MKVEKEKIYDLYQKCFPYVGCKEELFYQKINVDSCHVIVEEENSLLKAAAVITEDTLTLFMVHPDYQRQGIGTKLLQAAEKFVKEKGYQELYLGFHSGQCLFQGVPVREEETSYVFFQKNGYEEIKWSVDLVMFLKDYDYENTLKLINAPDLSTIVFRYAQKEDAKRLEEAVKEVDEDWCQYVTPESPTLLVEEYGEIMGFECVNTGGFKSPGSPDLICGAVGCVGVVPMFRKRGIGKVMVAYGTNELKKQKVDVCYIGFTHLEKWYQSMGFETFLRFWMGKKTI